MDIDQSLDAMIKSAPKKKLGRRRRQEEGQARAQGQDLPDRQESRRRQDQSDRQGEARPQGSAMAVDTWAHDKFKGPGPAGGTAKLIISNLHPNVTNQDIAHSLSAVPRLSHVPDRRMWVESFPPIHTHALRRRARSPRAASDASRCPTRSGPRDRSFEGRARAIIARAVQPRTGAGRDGTRPARSSRSSAGRRPSPRRLRPRTRHSFFDGTSGQVEAFLSRTGGSFVSSAVADDTLDARGVGTTHRTIAIQHRDASRRRRPSHPCITRNGVYSIDSSRLEETTPSDRRAKQELFSQVGA